ncbi:hypothetical protein FBU59_001661 [Linderina macrospora]|uniref:Uncharacterized protein n=1 Tax=Linderina macrospora TaxID=4868 RepID=A0ACC1JDB2_9FUNG|nr:hypothetical protein FBU59_001661 [Linderina macrospora]
MHLTRGYRCALLAMPRAGWFQPALSASALVGGQKRFAGHNKWSKIKHTKGAADVKKGTLFANLSKDITAAAKGRQQHT